jgi:hemin uptake protein HemP
MSQSVPSSIAIKAIAAHDALAPRVRIDSRELLQGARELVIRHGDQEYRLRHTQNDKLILTK